MREILFRGKTENDKWVFMQLYGPHIGMALPEVVSDLNIYF